MSQLGFAARVVAVKRSSAKACLLAGGVVIKRRDQTLEYFGTCLKQRLSLVPGAARARIASKGRRGVTVEVPCGESGRSDRACMKEAPIEAR